MAASTEPLLRHIYRLVSPPHSEPAGDAALLDRFASHRDESAFAALVARHGPMVLGVCRRILRDSHEAEDVFQATFLVLARKASRLRRPETLAAWLYGTARHLALTAQRGNVRRCQRERTVGVRRLAEPSGNPLDELTAREMLLVVDEELASLPEMYRLPLILCGLEGRTHEEAARLLGWTPGSVKGRLERGRARLHDRLVRRGLALSAAMLPLVLTPSRISASLIDTTVRTAQAFALGIRDGIAAQTRTLAESALASAMTIKVKIGVLLLAMGLILGTAGIATPSRERERAVAAPLASARGSEKIEPARTDRYGDPLPDGALARLGTIRFRQGFFTTQVAFSPDGKIIACAGEGRGLCLWDAATGKELRRIGSAVSARSVAFSPNGKVLACICEPSALNKVGASGLYETATGRKIADLPEKIGYRSLAFSPNGQTLAAAADWGKAIYFFDAATGAKRKTELSSEKEEMQRLAWSPDSELLAAGSVQGFLHLWNAVTGEKIARWKADKYTPIPLDFSPDGRMLVSASDSIRLWDVATHKMIRTIGNKRDVIPVVRFSRDGQMLASGHGDGTIALWNAATGEEIRRWKVHAYSIVSLDFSPDGQTLVSGAAWASGPRLWDVATGKEVRPFAGHTASVDGLLFSSDGRRLLSLGREKHILEWDLANERATVRFRAPMEARMDCFVVSPQGNLAASWEWGDRGTVRLWDVAKQRELRAFGKFRNRRATMIAPVEFSPDGRWLAFETNDGIVSIWDTVTGKRIRQFQGLHAGVLGIAFSPDGKRIAAGSGPAGGRATLALWNMETGESVTSFSGVEPVYNLAFSPDGKLLASGSWQGPPRLWDATSGQELRRLNNGPGAYGVAFSPDGKWLAVAGEDKDQKVHVWEVNTGLEVRCFSGHFTGVTSIAFAPDGRTLASGGGDSTVLLWDFTGRRKNGRWQTVTLTPQELERCWRDLASNQGPHMVQAIWDLAASPRQAVSLLRKRIQPVRPADAERVEQLIRDLDSEEFETRKKASEELEKIVDRAEPILRKKLTEKPPLEVRQRIRNLLNASLPGKRLRTLRAVQVLEYAGTPEAREHLRTLAGGMPEAQLTREAKAALGRSTKK